LNWNKAAGVEPCRIARNQFFSQHASRTVFGMQTLRIAWDNGIKYFAHVDESISVNELIPILINLCKGLLSKGLSLALPSRLHALVSKPHGLNLLK
jgi:hypothetical protein